MSLNFTVPSSSVRIENVTDPREIAPAHGGAVPFD
jgi:hypothetical protein